MCSAPQNVNGDWLCHETHVKYQETVRNIGCTLKQIRNNQILVSLGKELPKATVNMILARLALPLFPFIILGNSHLNWKLPNDSKAEQFLNYWLCCWTMRIGFRWFQVTAKKFHTLVTCKGQSTSLLKSTKIHFPEGLNSQLNETTNTISSTRSPDLMVLFTGITMDAAVSSPKVIPSSWYLCV